MVNMGRARCSAIPGSTTERQTYPREQLRILAALAHAGLSIQRSRMCLRRTTRSALPGWLAPLARLGRCVGVIGWARGGSSIS
jgi:hypothetical protein